MKVRLYGADIRGRVEWRLTLNLDIDCAYWFEQYGGKASLHLLEPVLSLGEAIPLLQALKQGTSLAESRAKWAEACEVSGIGQTVPFDIVTITYRDYAAQRREDPIDPKLLARLEELLAGRCLSRDELLSFLEHHGLDDVRTNWGAYLQAAYLRGRVELTNGVAAERKQRFWWTRPERRHRCRRCGSGPERMYRADCLHCAGECVYCEECLTMGRMQSCSLLVYGTAGHAAAGNRAGRMESAVVAQAEAAAGSDRSMLGQERSPGEVEHFIAKWNLSPAQSEAAAAGLAFLNQRRSREGPRRFLVWAVTGAGKTEMIFPFIDYELQRGGSVLIATPRRDVVLELRPRLRRAFPERSIATLYGGSEERWETGDITLSTTHQLLRFYRKFDLVIIDEIDAFPYHNNPMLQYAAERVCTASGAYILLSATPPAERIREAKRGRLPHVKVPVRYHRHPLPVPVRVAAAPPDKWKGRLPARLYARVRHSLNRGAQLFVFVPRIRDVEVVAAALRHAFADCTIDGTSSKDPLRAEKVVRFRQGDIRMLVTTTILERGVTVPKTDVFIVQADSDTFDSSALIQMAGRAGRSKDDPHGNVVFAAAEWTNSQSAAIRQIREMNRLAKRKGYLIDT